MSTRLFFTLWLALLILIFAFQLHLPLTAFEAKSGYTAYSLLHTGTDAHGQIHYLWSPTNGEYVFIPLALLRLPTILLFGLNPLGIRAAGLIVTVLVGVLSFARHGRTPIFFMLSPIVLVSSVFSLELVTFFLFATIAHLLRLRPKLILLFISVVVFLVPLSNSEFRNFFLRTTRLANIRPSNFTYIYDRKLAIGQTTSSPLFTNRFNFNRLGYNKILGTANMFLIHVASPLSFEQFIFPFLSPQTTAPADATNHQLPRFYWFDVVLIVAALVLLVRRGRQTVPVLLLTMGIYIVWPTAALGLLLLWGHILILPKLPVHMYRGFVVVWAVHLLFFVYLFLFQPTAWLGKNDQVQFFIWHQLKNHPDANTNIFITDAYGEPAYFAATYLPIPPALFHQQLRVGPLLSSGYHRLTSLGQFHFGSFKYAESDRQPHQIWYGTPQEFANPTAPTELPDGQVTATFHNQLWEVSTTF